MRTPRRPLAFAATLTTALLGVGLIAGASPAAAAAQNTNAAVTDCSTTAALANGMIDIDLLQTCLDQVQASLMDHHLPDEAPVAEDETAVSDEPVSNEPVSNEPVSNGLVYPEPFWGALDPVFAVDIPVPAEPAEEEAPIDNGLDGAFAALAECESGGNYSINTGNGYYGAYQFALATWQGIGYEGYPHEASPAVQDQAARELQALYGWGQWPGCSWYLGL